MRVLALDYGKKRIGLALSDPLKITAQPHGFLPNDRDFFGALKNLIKEKEVSEIVLGHPHSMSGQPSAMTKEVEAFADKLKSHVAVPVFLYDERLTSAMAERSLIEGNVRREDRKQKVDAVAAALLLKTYLQSKSFTS